MKTTRTIKHKYTEWDNILDHLIDTGISFYELYGDIEAAILDTSPNAQSEFEITLTGSNDAWEEFDAIEKEVTNG